MSKYHVAFFFFFCSAFCIQDLTSHISHAHEMDPVLSSSTYVSPHSKEWLRLLLYEPTFLGGYQSQARTADFFLSPEGPHQPEQEMKSLTQSLMYFNLVPEKERDNHPRCRFPARSTWLAQKKGILLPPESWCPQLSAWKNKIQARSVTYVFSSYYVNNPSSAFGHTLLRLNRKNLNELEHDSEGRQLLDFGANYGVTPTTKNPILYGFFALAGLFPGNFIVLPYFYKVREYNDYESRDLWEYDLRLEPTEIEQLTNHLWELTHTQYTYLYLTKNCGYQILALLEAAAPRLDLTKKLRTWVIPSDTVKVIQEANLIQNTRFRPSIRTQFYFRKDRLKNKQEQKSLREFNFQSPQSNDLSFLDLKAQARVLDAAIDLMDLSYAHEILIDDSPIRETKDEMLLQRSRLPPAEDLNLSIPQENSPLEGHGSGRLKLSHIWQKKSNETELAYRGALHDLLDRPNGYPRYTRIEMGLFRFRFHLNAPSPSIRLEEINLFGIESLNPWSDFNHKPSWRVDLGVIRLSDFLCDQCMRTRFITGFGISKNLHPLFLVYALGNFDIQFSSRFASQDWRAGLGPSIGFVLEMGKYLGLRSEAQQIYYWQNDRFKKWPFWQTFLRYSPRKSWAMEGSAKFDFHGVSAESAVYFYF